MISIGLLVLTCFRNAKEAKKIGKNPELSVLLTVGLWLAAIAAGAVIGALLAKTAYNDMVQLVLFCLPVFVFGCLGAGAAALLIQHRKNTKSGNESERSGVCPGCGKPLIPGSAFCGICGMPVSAFTAPPAEAEPEKKKGNGLKIALICGGSCLVAAGLAIGIWNFLPSTVNRRAYAEAMNAYNEGRYNEAEEGFAAIDGYEDAADMAVQSQKMGDYAKAQELAQSSVDSDLLSAAELFEGVGDFLDAPVCAENCRNEVTYCRAADLMAQENYEQAAKLFSSVSQYRDAKAQAEECLHLRDYDRALQLYQAENYAKALELFRALDTYKDSEDMAMDCQNHVDYAEAMTLMDSKSYEDAASILEKLMTRGYLDAAEKLDYCRGAGVYELASSYLNDGKNYEARKLFLSIPDFEDAAQKAESCIIDNPGSKELYRNPDYSNKSVTFKVKNNSDSNAVVKMYKNNDLVTMFFIPAGKTTSVKIPTGTYSINRGFGQEWYGNNDLFGDEGRYYRLEINGHTEFTFESGLEYSLGVEEGGTAVGQQSTGRENC